MDAHRHGTAPSLRSPSQVLSLHCHRAPWEAVCPCRPAQCPSEQDPSTAPQTTVNTEASGLAGRQTPGPFPSALSHEDTRFSRRFGLTCERSLPELHDGCKQHAEQCGEAWDVRHQGGLAQQHGGPCGRARRAGGHCGRPALRPPTPRAAVPQMPGRQSSRCGSPSPPREARRLRPWL